MNLPEIHRLLRIPLISAARIFVYTVQTLGYFERNADSSHYRLSLKVLAFCGACWTTLISERDTTAPSWGAPRRTSSNFAKHLVARR
jgi:hypothetical protein